jgi:hypothetical protein
MPDLGHTSCSLVQCSKAVRSHVIAVGNHFASRRHATEIGRTKLERIRAIKSPLGERRLAKRQGLGSRLDLDTRKGMNCPDHTTAQRICSRQSRHFAEEKTPVVVASLDLRRSRARVRECDLMDVDKTQSLWTPKVYRHYRTVAGHSQVRLRRRELPSNSFIFASHETESSTILTTPTQDARSDE